MDRENSRANRGQRRHPAAKPWSRRKFVTLSSTGLVTVGLLSGCGFDDDDDGGTAPPPGQPMAPVMTFSPESFPQSIASGDPRPDSMVFWTRALNPGEPGATHRTAAAWRPRSTCWMRRRPPPINMNRPVYPQNSWSNGLKWKMAAWAKYSEPPGIAIPCLAGRWWKALPRLARERQLVVAAINAKM